MSNLKISINDLETPVDLAKTLKIKVSKRNKSLESLIGKIFTKLTGDSKLPYSRSIINVHFQSHYMYIIQSNGDCLQVKSENLLTTATDYEGKTLIFSKPSTKNVCDLIIIHNSGDYTTASDFFHHIPRLLLTTSGSQLFVIYQKQVSRTHPSIKIKGISIEIENEITIEKIENMYDDWSTGGFAVIKANTEKYKGEYLLYYDLYSQLELLKLPKLSENTKDVLEIRRLLEKYNIPSLFTNENNVGKIFVLPAGIIIVSTRTIGSVEREQNHIYFQK